MGVRILSDRDSDQAALFCSTTEWAFGPIFHDDGDHDADERAEAFCRWLGAREPRRMTDAELRAAYQEWRSQEAAQWTEEEAESNL